MDRRRRMLQKRRRKQRLADEGLSLSRSDPSKIEKPGTKLIFGVGTAAVKGRWIPRESEGNPPPALGDQP